MRILITGGAGYIGSVLTAYLLQEKYEVTIVDNFMFGQSSLTDLCWHENLKIIRGDCRDEKIMKAALKNADVIIPLAALVGAPMCDKDRVGATSLNQVAIEMLCRNVSKEQRILMPVTNSGYGIGSGEEFCTEESPLRPISLYGTTKVNAESAILERENSISFRLATVFGISPRMRLDLLVNDFVYRAVNDRALVIFEGHFKRNFIHIRDVAKVFLHGIKNFEKMRGEAYNVGLEEANLSKIQLCELIQSIIPQFVFIEAPIGEDPDKRNYIVSNQKILKTGYTTDWSLERGVHELIKGYQIIRNSKYGNV
jgi:nucleoside-diphosphate-sugar epimerase